LRVELIHFLVKKSCFLNVNFQKIWQKLLLVNLHFSTMRPSKMNDLIKKHDSLYEINDALLRFANGMDTDDGGLISSAFAEHCIVDFTPAAKKVGMQFPVLEGRANTAAALVPFASVYITSHSVTNVRISLSGEAAKMYALVEAQHIPVNDSSRYFMMKNQYDIDLIRTDDTWCITQMIIKNVWVDGDVRVMTDD
jgi:hypothetical protein